MTDAARADETGVRSLTSRLALLRARIAHEQAGFTLVELLSAVLVVSIGVIALITTFDTSRRLVSFSEAKETAVHLAEQELERLQGLPYEQLALTAQPGDGCTPSPCTDPDQIGYYLRPPGWYRWDQDPTPTETRPAPPCAAAGALAQPITNCEPLVVDAAGAVSPTRRSFETATRDGSARLTLELQRLVTAVDDDCTTNTPGTPAPACDGGADLKRISVAVRVVRASGSARLDGGPKHPIVLSTVVQP